MLLGFGASHFFFNRGEISTSVPLAYPVLLYVLARMLWIGFRPRERRERLVPHVPMVWLALALVFLVGFRVALNVVDSSVIDVGYAGVIGADKITHGHGLYDSPSFAKDNEHGDTYGPVNYLAYVPFEQALPFDGTWGDLPGGARRGDRVRPAHAARAARARAAAARGTGGPGARPGARLRVGGLPVHAVRARTATRTTRSSRWCASGRSWP